MRFLVGFLFLFLASLSFVSSAQTCPGLDFSCPPDSFIACHVEGDTIYGECFVTLSDLKRVTLDQKYICPEGFIIDYNTLNCCPSHVPYNVGNICTAEWKDALSSNNYFTQSSVCFPGEDSCSGFDFLRCQQLDTQFVYEYKNLGEKPGFCGFEVCYLGDTECIDGVYNICEFNKWVPYPSSKRCDLSVDLKPQTYWSAFLLFINHFFDFLKTGNFVSVNEPIKSYEVTK